RAKRTRDDFFGNFLGNQYEYKRFAVSSKPAALDISQLPNENRPAEFYGLVGNYIIEAAANPTKVNVGDPITLTIKIGGEKYLTPVQWPKLENIGAFIDNFKIPAERADGQIKDGFKVFTQTIRANNENVKQIPPVPLTYFDAKKGEYVTVKSEPIPLEVSATRVVTQADIEGAAPNSLNRKIEAVKEGLSASYSTADALVNQRFSITAALLSIWFIILWVMPFSVLVTSFVLKMLITSSPARKKIKRKKQAYGRTVKLISVIGKSGNVDGELTAALKQYIADKFDRPAGSLTAEDCRILIYQKTGDNDISGEFKKIMEEIEEAAYSPANYQFSHEKKILITELLRKIEGKL
ncbi:MAG TPA: BatD family protein, partial [Patescibacteria group bacterium]|nr:BatD family protein [Patescibacteria group bacterium]